MEEKVTDKSPSIGTTTTTPKDGEHDTNSIPSEFMEFFSTGHAHYDDYMYPSDKSPIPTEDRKQQLRKKRKKNGKKTHRKKK